MGVVADAGPEDAVTYLEALDELADPGHLAGDVDARGEGEFDGRVRAIAEVGVDGVDARGSHLDEQFVAARARALDFVYLEYVAAAVFVETYGLHSIR